MDASSRTIGIVLIVVGGLLFLGQLAGFGRVGWPLFIVHPGLVMLVLAFLGNEEAAGLAVPGSIVTLVGIVLWLQAITGRFETWAYAWGLVMASVGIGSFLEGSLTRDEPKQRDGIRFATLGLVLFAAAGVFFELLIFGGFAAWVWTYGLPLALIVAGAVLVLRRSRAR